MADPGRSRALVPARICPAAEIASARGLLQLLSREIARAAERVWLCAPAEAYPILAPALRRAQGQVASFELRSNGPAALEFAEIGPVADAGEWPGDPIICVVDRRSAVLAGRVGEAVQGQWSSVPAFVAGAAAAFQLMGGGL